MRKRDMLLTPLEWAVLHVIRCAYAFRRPLLGLLLVLVVLRFFEWAARGVHRPPPAALAPSAPAPSTAATLWNPDRLEEMIRLFVLPSPHNGASSARGGVPGSPPERHRTEAVCRELLEYMLQMPLPKVRPPWLVNPTTKRRLELDMYNEENRIAFEYDGAQHDVFTPHFHANEHHFEYRRLLDRLKTELCREKGVLLMRIPWSEVSASDRSLTARYLQRMLAANRLPHRPPSITT